MLSLDPSPYVSTAETEPGGALPPQPKTLRDTGLPQQLIVELIAKAIYVGGRTHLPVLTTKLHLSINVLREALDFLVAEHVAEVAWRGESDIDVQYQLTAAGKQRASAWMERCRYVGPAPVTLEAYRAMVERQAGQAPRLCADDLAAEFADDFSRRRCSRCSARPCTRAARCCFTARRAAASRRWRGASAPCSKAWWPCRTR